MPLAKRKAIRFCDGLFAQVMIDAGRSAAPPPPAARAVQHPRRLEIVAERLLYDHAGVNGRSSLVTAWRLISPAGEVLQDGPEGRRRHRQVEHAVAGDAARPVDLLEARLQADVRGRVVEVPLLVEDPLREALQSALSTGLRRGVLVAALAHLCAELVVGARRRATPTTRAPA